MLRLNEPPIGDTHPLYQTFKGVLEHPGKPATDVVVKVLRPDKSEEEEDAFEELFARTYKAADLGDRVVYYRNYIEGETLKQYLARTKPDDDTVMDLSTKLLSFLNFLHIEKQFHNKLTDEHILLQEKKIYLISADNSLSNSPRKDIGAFGEVLNEMLGMGQKDPFYRDILAKCRGGNDYFRTISDVLYRFKNRVKKIQQVPDSFDSYVLDQLSKNGHPPSKSTRQAINAQAYRMVIDDELIDAVIARNVDKVTPPKIAIPRWVYLIIPILLVVGVGVTLLNKKGGDAPAKLSFDLEGDHKKEMGETFTFTGNTSRKKDLLWKVYDYRGRKIIQHEKKTKISHIPEKPGKYFITLENVNDSKSIHKDTIQVMWPGGKAQFSVQQIGNSAFRLKNESLFADSVFYDMGDGLKRMTGETLDYEYTDITEPTTVSIQFAAYANGQADLQTKSFRVTPSDNNSTTTTNVTTTPVIPNEPHTIDTEPEKPIVKTTPPSSTLAPTPKPQTIYKKPIIRVMNQDLNTQTIGFRLSGSTIDPSLTYEWEVSGQKQKGTTVYYSTRDQEVMQVFVRAMKGDKVVHKANKMVSVKKQQKNDSPFKSINNTDLFKGN